MRFSLVLATVGRVKELERFFSALESQDYPGVEVLLVDQNPDDRLRDVLNAAGARFKVHRLRSERGLSRARNIAMPYISGDIVAFPDDDCWYPADLLQRVAATLTEHPEWEGVTGRPAGPTGTPWRGWEQGYGILTRRTVLRRGISFTIFLRRRVVEAVGRFDDTLGAGAGTPWDWGEETDYLLRSIDRGFRIYDDASILVHHPEPADPSSPWRRVRAYSYSTGTGHFLRKHKYSIAFLFDVLLRNAAGMLYSLVTLRVGRALHHWAIIRGLIKGYSSPVTAM